MAAAGALDAHVEEKLNTRVPRPSPNFARALALAAIRETFEETGLAIGVLGPSTPVKPPPGAWSRFAATGVHPSLDAMDFLALVKEKMALMEMDQALLSRPVNTGFSGGENAG